MVDLNEGLCTVYRKFEKIFNIVVNTFYFYQAFVLGLRTGSKN